MDEEDLSPFSRSLWRELQGGKAKIKTDGVAVVVFVLNIFFYFIRINVSEHVEKK
jgi:hypothetical protein